MPQRSGMKAVDGRIVFCISSKKIVVVAAFGPRNGACGLQMNMQSNNHAPSVTVLLPVYNGEQFIEEAVTSILAQSFTDFGVLVMDDGSTDGTDKILRRLAANDARIRIHQRENRGLIATLNEGLALCSSELVARMDADDYALPHRLAVQYDYMTEHPETAVCSSGMEEYETGRILAWEGCGEAVRARLLFGCCLHHPTIMARRSVLLDAGGYDAAMPSAEDYDLWVRLTAAGYSLAVLPQVLLRYRVHPHVSRTAYKWQMGETTSRIQRRQLALLGISPTPRQLDRHQFCISHCPELPGKLQEAEAWLQMLVEANDQNVMYNREVFLRTVNEIKKDFVRSSWQRDPGQYVRRILRTIVKDGIYRLRLGENFEKRIVGAARRLGFFSQSRKQ